MEYVNAEAARDSIMAELVTKQALGLQMQVFTTSLRNSELRLEGRMDNLELRMVVRLGGLSAMSLAILAANITL